MTKSVNQRVEALRKRRALLGLKRVEYYLNDAEKEFVGTFIKTLRQAVDPKFGILNQ